MQPLNLSGNLTYSTYVTLPKFYPCMYFLLGHLSLSHRHTQSTLDDTDRDRHLMLLNGKWLVIICVYSFLGFLCYAKDSDWNVGAKSLVVQLVTTLWCFRRRHLGFKSFLPQLLNYLNSDSNVGMLSKKCFSS